MYTRQENEWAKFFLTNKETISKVGDPFSVLRHVRSFLRGQVFDNRRVVIFRVRLFGISFTISRYI